MKRDDYSTFIDTLSRDTYNAADQYESDPSQYNRRNLVRAAFSAIEGYHYLIKHDIFINAEIFTQLSIHEVAALKEETFFLNP